jgi:hypothetical protein
MRVDSDGLPKVGNQSKCLGVREPPNQYADVDIDQGGNVVLNRRGMSVVADWRLLPGHLLPEHLDDGHNGASGKGMRVFVHGTGEFADATAVAAALILLHKPRTSNSGNVTPKASVPLAQFQKDLHATRSSWSADES